MIRSLCRIQLLNALPSESLKNAAMTRRLAHDMSLVKRIFTTAADRNLVGVLGHTEHQRGGKMI